MKIDSMTDPTIEESVTKQVVVDGLKCNVEIDYNGTEDYEGYTSLGDMWIRNGNGFVLVYSTSCRSSFSHITKYYNDIRRTKDSDYPAGADSANFGPDFSSMVLIGSHNDETEREVSTQDGIQLGKELGCKFFQISTQSVIKVNEAFCQVIRRIRQRQRLVVEARSSLKPRQRSEKILNKGFLRPKVSQVWQWVREDADKYRRDRLKSSLVTQEEKAQGAIDW
jgi:GTPase KRas protein